MGSFNASCAVSHCSINPGDRVKLIPIVSNTPLHDTYSSEMHKGFACYATDNFSVIGYAMDATYEDYGDFEVVQNRISDYNLSIIRENYTKNVPKEDEDRHSISDDRNGYNVNGPDLTWAKIGELIHFGNMNLDTNSSGSRQRYLGFFPVHECVWKVLMDRTPEMYLENSFDNVSFDKFLEYKKEQSPYQHDLLAQKIAEYMETYAPLIGETDKYGKIITVESMYDKAEMMAEMSIDSNRERKDYSYKNSSQINALGAWASKTEDGALTEAEHYDIVFADAELVFAIRGLNDLQIPMIPPMTAGQEYDKTDHATFLIRVGQELLDMQKRRDGEDYEDEEEYESEERAVINIDANITASLKNIKSAAVSDWKQERGVLVLDAVDKFIVQYPQGVTINANELRKQGYGSLLSNFPTTLLPIVFVNDIVED